MSRSSSDDDDSSVILIRRQASATPEFDSAREEKEILHVTLRFDHLKHFFQAAAASGNQAADMPSAQLTPDQLAKSERQRETLQRRIKQNVKAFVTESWDDLKVKYKPSDPVVKKDSMWDATVKQQDDLMAKINTAKQAKQKGDRKVVYDLIMDIREQFPEYVKKLPEPEKPAPPKQKEIEKPAPCPPPSAIPATPPPAYNPSGLMGRPRGASNSFSPFLAATAPQARPFRAPTPIKREGSPIEILDDEEESDGDAEEDPKDDTFDPKIEAPTPTRDQRAAKRQRVKGPEFGTKVKNATSREDLQFQLEELKIQFRLKEILIEKKLASMDGKDDFDLQDEEITKQSELKRMQLKRARKAEEMKMKKGGGGDGQ